MAQQFRVLTCCSAENLGLNPSTHMVAHKPPLTLVPGPLTPSSSLYPSLLAPGRASLLQWSQVFRMLPHPALFLSETLQFCLCSFFKQGIAM